jgi:hypothetical protein
VTIGKIKRVSVVIEKKLEIGGSLKLTFQRWEYATATDTIEFTYTNESSDPWYSDYSVELPVEKEKAKEIVGFLSAAFDLEEERNEKIRKYFTGQYHMIGEGLIEYLNQKD